MLPLAAPPRRRAPDEGVDETPASLGVGPLTQGGGQGHISVDGGAESVPTPPLAAPPTSPLTGGGLRRGGRDGETRGRHRGRDAKAVDPFLWTRPRAGRGPPRHRGLGRQMVAGITVVDGCGARGHRPWTTPRDRWTFAANEAGSRSWGPLLRTRLPEVGGARCGGRGREAGGSQGEASRPLAAAMDESAGRLQGPPRRTRRRGLRPSTMDRQDGQPVVVDHGAVNETAGPSAFRRGQGHGEGGLPIAVGEAGQ